MLSVVLKRSVVFKVNNDILFYSLQDQHCNALLFVFSARTPRKLALKIWSLVDGVDIFTVEKCKLNIKLVNDQLRQQHKPVLPLGSIDDLGPTHAKLRVYVLKFDNTQPCSEVFETDVNVYEQPPYKMDISTGVKRNVGWSFFSLISQASYDVRKHFDESGRLKQPFIYLDPDTEKERMDPLLQTIREHYNLTVADSGIKSKIVSGQGDRLMYCEFTGGGDIYLQRNGKSLVICNTREEDLSLSPVHETESVSSLVIEGKLLSKKRTLTHQLIANTILCCVEQFVNGCKNKEHNETFLKKMMTLSGYGVPYTGEGYVGFYKLTMEFNKQTTFRAIVEPGIYDRSTSAAYVDYALEYFFG